MKYPPLESKEFIALEALIIVISLLVGMIIGNALQRSHTEDAQIVVEKCVDRLELCVDFYDKSTKTNRELIDIITYQRCYETK